MSASAISFLLGSLAAYMAERTFATNDTVRWLTWALALVLVGGAIAVRARTWGRHPKATGLAVGFYALAASAVIFYGLQLRDVVEGFGFTPQGAERWRTAMQAAMALVWTIGALPGLALDRTLSQSPQSVHPLRLRTALDGGLALAFGLSMIPPILYLGNAYNERFDYGFFKVTSVGSSSEAAVANLPEPMRMVLFFSPSSEVLREVRPYADDLVAASNGNLTLEVMDQAMSPEQAKAWKVKDNGNIVFVRGEGDDERTETVKIGEDLSAARKDLRKLDSKVQTALLKIGRDKRTAYFTAGHGELYWKNAKSEMENADILKKGVESLNFKVKELGADDGLANAVPEDAAVVFIVGPTRPFFPEEIQALTEYRDAGGAIFLMLDGGGELPDPELAALLGVSFDPTNVLSDKQYARATGGPSDRGFVPTNKYSSHESVTTLSKNSQQALFVLVNGGSIKELPEHPGKYTATIKGMGDWWSDLDGNFEFDKDAEKRGGIEVAAVVSGPAADGKEWRGAVVSDATWASNAILPRSQANAVYLIETLGWLTKDPALQGETESEEDVKIQHTKEGEAMWFYGTSVFMPLLVFLAGLFRVNRRRRQGAA